MNFPANHSWIIDVTKFTRTIRIIGIFSEEVTWVCSLINSLPSFDTIISITLIPLEQYLRSEF